MNEIKRILNFWKEVNLLTPVTVKSSAFKNQESLSPKEVLKVPYNSIEDSLLLSNDKKYEIEIGFGDIKNTYLYEKGNIEKEDFVDGDGGESFIFTFKIDGDKKYKEGSFTISKFTYILLKDIISKIYDYIEDEIKEFNEKINTHLKSYENYNVENIKKITSFILKELDICNIVDEKILKKSFYLKLFKSNEEEDSNESSFCQMDFYTRDLETIINADLKDNSLLSNIIYSKENKNRQKIDDNKEFLEEITLPKNMPIGKWPSKFNPSLMQAAAINICTSKDYTPNIFSVNGPPGTGKTTLLKEIIADTIVKKAKIIAGLDPTNLDNTIQTNTNESYYRNYYKIPEELKKLGIIVSSNNNAAVENISKDLPKAKDVLSDNTLTDLFNNQKHKNIYFTEDSKKIFGDNSSTWGLISAPYGRKENIQKILNILPKQKQKNEDFNFSFGENIPNFEKARKIFEDKYKEVLKYREDFNSNVKQFFRNKDKMIEINNSLGQISNLKNKIENLIEELKKVQDNKEYKDSVLKQKREQKSNIEISYSFLTKIVKKFTGEKNPKILELNKDIEMLNEELININKDLRNIENDKEELNKKIQVLENSKKILKELEEKINMFFETYSSNEDENDLKLLERCSDLENFYSNIISNEKTQESCPWGVKEFNILREELFACSLSLIEAYIVNSKGIKANLKLLKLLLSGGNLGYSPEERKNVFKECFHTLNLLIPVLSTTFASVSRAFKDFEENELGIVIIDEAGQATPFSAMGLLYRANRCIIVGDPLQVEPVMTVPSTLIRAIANKYELNKLEKEFNIAGKIFNYTSPSLSIQTLADYANLYYGKIGETEVGCPLVVHRRCLSPMFDISNSISYDRRMINKCIPDNQTNYVLEKNEFIDVKGQEIGNGNHYVKEQGEKIIEIINNYIKNNFENNKIEFFKNHKNLYVISPFTTVVNEIKNDINKTFKEECQGEDGKDKLKEWCENCIGTVHRFQGKEANSVILLLGCDENSKNSAKWAAQAANILNVAATRAKKRFAIIGDLELWGKLEFFKESKEILDEFNKNNGYLSKEIDEKV